MAQVVIGVRRCGKSTLCYNVLKENGELFAYANFDDERFEEMTSKDLNTVLEVLYKMYGDFKLLFLDEIQNVDGWHLFVNRILRRNKPLERDVYYFKNDDGYEADFVVCKGDKVEEVYQVSYDLTKKKTRAREIRGLLTASKNTRCDNLFLITDVERSEFEQGGKLIKIIPAYEWLIQ